MTLELYHNSNIIQPSGSNFPSSIGGDDLIVSGTYTINSNGVVLSGTDAVIQTGNTTFQTVSLWFRFNDITSFDLFGNGSDVSASIAAVTTVTQARSTTGASTAYVSGWQYGTMTQYRYDAKSKNYSHIQGTNVVQGLIGATSGSHGRTFRNLCFATVLDFDYRYSADQYCGIDINNDVATSILGVRVALTTPWTGTAKCVRYRASDDKFIIMVEGNSDQVYILDGDTGVFTSVYSNVNITIEPRSLAVNGDVLYFIGSDSLVYSLDISSNSNVPVQLGVNSVSSQLSINYYAGKVYVQVSNKLVEIEISTGQEYSMNSPDVTQFRIYALDFEQGYVSYPTSNDRNNRASYDFKGFDGKSYTLTESTNTISKTYIDGNEVSSLEDLLNYSYGTMHNVVVVFSNPSTSTLTLFGNSSGSNSPDVTVETIATFSDELEALEVSYAYNTYIKNNQTPAPIPRISIIDVTDFSVDVCAIIDIDDLVGYQSLTSAVYTGTFNSANTFSLNSDIDFVGETKSTINNFQGTFNGNGYRLSNHDGAYIFNTITTGASLNNIIFHNFNSPSQRGITDSVSGTASITNCVCCGTFATSYSTFCQNLAATVVFEDNIVALSGSSRIVGGEVGGIVGRDSDPMTRCFFSGTSDVVLQGSHAGCLVGESDLTGENACNFNGYIFANNHSGGLIGQIDNTPLGCVGLYACGSFDIFNVSNNVYSGRVFGTRASGTVDEVYYYGSGDVSTSSINYEKQLGNGVNSGTTFSELLPSINGSDYLKSDEIEGSGLKGVDTSVWAGDSFSGPDILKNVPHIVPVESFGEINDPIGTIQLHLTNKTDYPVFMKFKFDDPSVSFTVLDTEFREITGYEAKIVSRHHTLTNTTETMTNPSGTTYFVNCTSVEFDAFTEPETIVGTMAKNITDFSVHVGDVIVGDTDDFTALFLENYTGTFHVANRFFQTDDIQYPDLSTFTTNSRINVFEGTYDGNGFRIKDIDVGTSFTSPWGITRWATLKNVSLQNIQSNMSGFFTGHTTGTVIKKCSVVGDIVTRGPCIVGGTSGLYGIIEDCHVLLSQGSYQTSDGVLGASMNSARRLFVASQPGHVISGSSDTGGVMSRAVSHVSKVGCNMRSILSSSRDRVGLLIGLVDSTITNQIPSKGYYCCGDTKLLGTDTSMRSDGIVGEDSGELYEFYSANKGDVIVNSNSGAVIPRGYGTAFSDFTGRTNLLTLDQLSIDTDLDATRGGIYSHDASLWTAPWDVSSNLDHASILIGVPHFIPVPDETLVEDPICTIQLYTADMSGHSVFFKIEGDKYETDYHVDVINNDFVSAPEDGSWVLQFVFPFAVESTKNVIFRGTVLTSTDSMTYVLGGIPLVPFTKTTVEAKNVTDFTVFSPYVITMNDIADYQAVIGLSEFHPLNVFNMTADIDLSTITDATIFNSFQGTFDGKGYRIKNRVNYVFQPKSNSWDRCVIQNIVFQNFQTNAPINGLFRQGRISNCIACGQFIGVTSGIVNYVQDLSQVDGCYALVYGSSNMRGGLSFGGSSGFLGFSNCFLSGSSSVLIQNSSSDTGGFMTSGSLGGGNAMNYKGTIEPSTTNNKNVGGICSQLRHCTGPGHYVCGDFDIVNGNGFVENLTGGISRFIHECYYANKGSITGGVSNQLGNSGIFYATIFSEYSGPYNNVELTEDNVVNGGCYSKTPDVWWSPWTMDFSRPSMLKSTPHFVPMENTETYTDVLGDITLEIEDISSWPIFVRATYLNDTDMEIKFFDNVYSEVDPTGIAAEITFPLAVTKNLYFNGDIVTSTDSLTYSFGQPFGTIVTNLGPNEQSAENVVDFSVTAPGPISLSTAADVQAMYRSNYAGAFNPINTYYLLNDIDLHQETFDFTNDRILLFRGKFLGQGFKLSNHQGFLINATSDLTIQDVTFLDFQACAINGGAHDAENIVFMSGNLVGTQTNPMLGHQWVNNPSVVKNMKVFIHGSATINQAACMGTIGGASELFLVTTSGVHSNISYGGGIMCNGGAGTFNIACNVNGTSTINGQGGILMRERDSNTILGGGYYVTGKLEIVLGNNTASWHTLNSFGWQGRADEGGVYTAGRGSVINSSGGLVTDDYLGGGAGYQTAFKDFVQGITEDQSGILGGMYDINTELWTVPWVLADHYDHPSMLKAIPHYMAIEDRNPIQSILGDITVLLPSYPMFLEIEFTDNGDGTDSFTYRIFDTTYTEVVDGVVVIMTYPFQARSETSVIFDNEVISADDNNPLLYFMGDPLFFLKQSPIAFEINWAPIAGAESYRLTYEYGTSGEITLVDDLTEAKYFVQNLTPETSYMMRLYSKDTGATEYLLAYVTTAFTNENIADNYDSFVTEILDETTGIFDLSLIDEDGLDLMGDILTDIFEDKAPLSLTVDSEPIVGVIAHPGTTVDVSSGAEAIVASFTPTGSGQFIDIEGETGNEQLFYNEADNTFTFNSRIYNIGDSILVNGKSLRIVDF